MTLEPAFDAEYAVLYHDKPVAIRDDYDEALWALHEHMRSHGLDREELQIGFRMKVTVHTTWQVVDKTTDFERVIDEVLPVGTVIHIR